MAELDPAHVEAVAEEVNGLTIGSGYYQARVGMDEAREAAEAILTSTDPNVHAALLAALVRAEVLSEERESDTLRMFGGKVVMCKARARFATEWAEDGQ